ncbi:MAG: hypothetical protein UV53_C0001G0018 [Candidatus Azambacteria bacterium GW2011_GWE1_42_9]|nr:MAG: hypothetical protein UU33_C0001G0277 [Candidatus Azambacteria bacterium GW2011_GWF1_41_10]KKS49311.1 MAG: hypothetical protein UV14_C0001G0057 [Candidatus Azambacteria bacterium GW2011_GWF2_42_22]KKS69307.1 MAG: hypothetical protein UV39_C0014G0007 [Candidatus Azambacteria bacterium GW2011_GWA2_42_62]KKS73984.1 MAG: hypothetical protein UV45_C0016G0006 [Candidatus Azambacteria bacterium GW2011_GWB1_42_72]KKS79801.1 MAG: hypothetical protein UV53_C0001G0018 [Candidatus Azambacteria bacte
MGTNKNEGEKFRHLNIILDQTSFDYLLKIKNNHRDSSYTQAIKRALAYLAFIEDQKKEGFDVYLIDRKKGMRGQLKKVTVVL